MSSTSPPRKREMQVLSLGLPRTGSMSMCRALQRLGYKNVLHGVDIMDDTAKWNILDAAADASFPVLPSYTGKPFTRAQWDELLGDYEGATDLAGPFAMQLIEAYPEAKVIVVHRDIDRWAKSVDESVLKSLWSAGAEFFITYVAKFTGNKAGSASRKMLLGCFEAKTVDEIRANMREKYVRHFEEIKAAVPPERLLLCNLGDGWGPLCEFLGKEVPDAEFPRANEAAELAKKILGKQIRDLGIAAKVIAPWAVGAAALGVGIWALQTQGIDVGAGVKDVLGSVGLGGYL